MAELQDISRRGDEFWDAVSNSNTESVLSLMIFDKIDKAGIGDGAEELARTLLQCKALLDLKDIEKLRNKVAEELGGHVELEVAMEKSY